MWKALLAATKKKIKKILQHLYYNGSQLYTGALYTVMALAAIYDLANNVVCIIIVELCGR